MYRIIILRPVDYRVNSQNTDFGVRPGPNVSPFTVFPGASQAQVRLRTAWVSWAAARRRASTS